MPRPPAGPYPTPRPRVLVVDDEPAVARAIAWALRAANADVVLAPQPSTALALLTEAAPFDLVLCDYVLGDSTGLSLLTAVRDTFGPRAGPVRALMSAGDIPDLPALLAAGVVERFVEKTSLYDDGAISALLAGRDAPPDSP